MTLRRRSVGALCLIFRVAFKAISERDFFNAENDVHKIIILQYTFKIVLNIHTAPNSLSHF
jgi:hypothetical protein